MYKFKNNKYGYKSSYKKNSRLRPPKSFNVILLLVIIVVTIIVATSTYYILYPPAILVSKPTPKPTPIETKLLVKPELTEILVKTSQSGRAALDIKYAPPPDYRKKIVYFTEPITEDKVIALTFDDGPWKSQTKQVLDILESHKIKATFFWIGKHLEEYSDIAKQVVKAGHAIGNHTWSHVYHKLDPATAMAEVEKTAKLIYDTTSVETFFLRPPGGILNNGVVDYAKQKNYAIIMWSILAEEPKSGGVQSIINRTLENAESGKIVLFHDGGGNHSNTISALPKIIELLKKQGYRFVTIPELLKL